MRSLTIVHPTRGEISFEPYPYQDALFADTSPSRVVLKARQTGISQAAAIEALYYALHNTNDVTLFISKNQDDASTLIRYVSQAYDALSGNYPDLVTDNKTELEFDNGSRIRSLPATRGAGRSATANRVYLDEFAFALYDRAIYTAARPTLSRGGQITVMSTPNGRDNLYYEIWSGQASGDWSRHHIHWRQCPEYDDEWYARERPNYTAQEWASEYETDFVISGLAVFNDEDVDACADGWLGLQPPTPAGEYITFWDIGRRRDATVGITLDIAPATAPGTWQLVAFERELGLPSPNIQRRIEERQRTYRGFTWVESNGPGDPVLENLNMPVGDEPEAEIYPYFTTRRNKIDMITTLQLAIEQRVLKQNIEQLTRELKMYQWDDSQLVQDCVMAAAGACHMANQPVIVDDVVELDVERVQVSPY